jgi:hypothetical protein
MLKELLSGETVKLDHLYHVYYLLYYFPKEINTLMIQKTYDGHYMLRADDISVCKEQKQ